MARDRMEHSEKIKQLMFEQESERTRRKRERAYDRLSMFRMAQKLNECTCTILVPFVKDTCKLVNL